MKAGYQSYDMDVADINYRVDADGREVTDIDKSQPGWRQRYPRKWRLQKLQPLIEAARNSDLPVFFCGALRCQADYYYLFDRIALLRITPDAMIHRINTRVGNDYGKDEDTQQGLLRNLKEWQDEISNRSGVIILDANRSAADVMGDLLERVS